MRQAILKVACGILLLGALLFVPAGTFDFWQAWAFLAALFIPMVIAGFVMMFKCPDLLRKRLNAKEEQPEQRKVIALSGGMFLAAFVIAGLNYRFGWAVLPGAVSVVALIVFLIAYALYAEVLRENAYLSRTIGIQQGQKVVDTGLYRIVRHPMYACTLFLFLSMPLILGSILSFAVMLAYIPIIGMRIRNEEQVLEEGLEGYRAYEEKVKYKVLPFVW